MWPFWEMRKSFRKTVPFVKDVTGLVVDLPAPPNLSIFWNFGSLLGLCLVVQFATGLFLAMHYTSHVDHAFAACVHISRDVNYGWLIRAWHANGASFFFFFLYLHVGRGIYYGCYRSWKVWAVGVVLILLLIGTAFIGYVLVWGQIRFWAATVITNLLSAIPYIGTRIVEWVWGGFAVSDATLHRFYVFHFLFPFILAVLTLVHLVYLHVDGSRNPLGVNRDAARVPFHPYYIWKDLLGIFVAIGIILWVRLLAPDMFLECENYIPANPLVTPVHIQPEWYFLWVYAILRAIPNKLGGVIALFGAVLILLALPIVDRGKDIIGCTWCVVKQFMFWFLIGDFLFLTWLGRCPAEEPFNTAAQVGRVLYFLFFIVFPVWGNWRKGVFRYYLFRAKERLRALTGRKSFFIRSKS